MSDTCRVTPFTDEEVGVTIEPVVSTCCEDISAPARVRYNGLYCHVSSALFTAYPTGLPPCSAITPPVESVPPTPVDPTDPPIFVPPPVDPPISNPPPVVEPVPTEPPPVIPVDPPPPVEPPPIDGEPTPIPPEPEIPPVVQPPNVLRFSRGVNYAVLPPGNEPMPDQTKVAGNDLAVKLSQYKTMGVVYSVRSNRGYAFQKTQAGDPELNPSSELYDVTQVIGGFNLRRAKAELSVLHNQVPDVRPFLLTSFRDGHMLLDDFTPGNAALWNGRTITAVEIESLARHAKSVVGWATCPLSLRGRSEVIRSLSATGFPHVDMIWEQLDPGSTPPSVVDPYNFYLNKWNIAKNNLKAGFIYGINLNASGAGSGYTGGWDVFPFHHPSRPNWWGMSPTEIRRVADAINALGHYRALGVYIWQDRDDTKSSLSVAQQTTYFLRSDIQAALLYLKNAVKDLKRGPYNYR